MDIFNQCPVGCFFSNLNCTQCAAGSYNGLSGQSSCILCPAGTSNPSIASTSIDACKACLFASYSASGQPVCIDCPPGYYCHDPARSPEICPVGSYCPAKSGAPSICQPGFLCLKEGLSQQLPCPSGHYCPSNQQNVPCPAGTFSSATGSGLCVLTIVDLRATEAA